jgi:histone-lysine N-methyltransferase SETMAR
MSRTVLYEIITASLSVRKFCARWVPKILTDAHKTQRFGSVFTFLQRYHKVGDELLNDIVTGNKTRVSLASFESNEQSKQWMHTNSTNKPKMFKQTSGRELMQTVFWDRK